MKQNCIQCIAMKFYYGQLVIRKIITHKFHKLEAAGYIMKLKHTNSLG